MNINCEDVDVTKENALFRSDAKNDNLLGKMLAVMANNKNIPTLNAKQLGINKKVLIVRNPRDEKCFFMMNPEVIRKSGNKLGRYKNITISFWDSFGRKQEIKFRQDLSILIQRGLNDMGIMV
jgi:peptide deformylase